MLPRCPPDSLLNTLARFVFHFIQLTGVLTRQLDGIGALARCATATSCASSLKVLDECRGRLRVLRDSTVRASSSNAHSSDADDTEGGAADVSSSSSSSAWDAWAAEDSQRGMPPPKAVRSGGEAAVAAATAATDDGLTGATAAVASAAPDVVGGLNSSVTSAAAQEVQGDEAQVAEPFAPSGAAAATKERDDRRALGLDRGAAAGGEQQSNHQQQAEQEALMSNLSSMVGILKETSLGLGDAVRDDVKVSSSSRAPLHYWYCSPCWLLT